MGRAPWTAGASWREDTITLASRDGTGKRKGHGAGAGLIFGLQRRPISKCEAWTATRDVCVNYFFPLSFCSMILLRGGVGIGYKIIFINVLLFDS